MTPEQQARQSIDTLLQQAGWHVCDMADTNIFTIQRLFGMLIARAQVGAGTHR